MDAVLATPAVNSFAELALAPVFRRRWASLYEALQDGRPDRDALLRLYVQHLSPIKQRFAKLEPFLNERLRRLYAATEAQALGYRGISAVARATGVSRQAISHGLTELATPDGATTLRIRRPRGGRKRTVTKDAPCCTTWSNWSNRSSWRSESPLRWTCKSVRKLADELNDQGHQVSHELVANLLKELGYSLQANRKTHEGTAHPDRNAQFEHINAEVQAFQSAGQPIISVDTKKKELVGDFKNGGRELCPPGEPEMVRVHDFVLPELGKAAPYGVYDVTHNLGWVNVGIDHDTAAFAVASIRRWWQLLGPPRYPGAQRVLITADGGGSNGRGCACGKSNSKNSPMKPGWRSACVICHRGPASGTRSSIGCFPILARTGGANR